MNIIKKTSNLLIENKELTLILLVAVFLRFFKLDFQSLWMDELYTMNVASSKHSVSEIISEVNQKESYPYIYFFLMNILFTLFGDISVVARIPSALFGSLAVFMMYKIGKELYSKNTGLIAALLLTFNHFAIYHSQEARAYTFYLFGLLVSYYLFIKFIKLPNKRNMILYALGTGLLVNTNFFSALNVVSQGFFMLFILFTLEKDDRNFFFKKILIITGIAALFFLPNIYKFYLVTKVIATFIPHASDEALINILREIFSSSIYLIFIYSTLFTFFMIKLFNQKKTQNPKEITSNKLVFSYLIIFSWIMFVLAIIIIKSYSGSSIFLSRYFMSIVPPFILLMSIALSNIKNIQVKASIISVVVFFLILDLFVVKQYYTTKIKSQYREASQLVIDKNKNNEPVYTSLKYWYDYYLNSNGVEFNVIEKPNLDAVIDEMMVDSTKIKPFWYVDAHGRPYKPNPEQLKFIEEKLYIDENFDGRDAWAKHFNLIKYFNKDLDISEFKPLKQNNGTSFKYNFDKFENTNNTIEVFGWACFDNINAKDSKIEILLINENEPLKAIKFLTQKVNRPDVTIGNKSNVDLSNSGFSSTYNKEKLPKGNYKIAVFVENKINNKKGLILTDKLIKIE